MKKYSLLHPNWDMWKQAMIGIPRVKSKSEWDALDTFSRWLISTRAAVILMTLFSAIIAGIFAAFDGMFDWPRFLILCFGLAMAHATNNILNDLSDHRKGVDKGNAFRTLYGTQPVEDGLITQQQSVKMALFTGILAVAAGIYLTWQAGWSVLPFFLVGFVLLFAYNWPLKWLGLGEPTVILVWGPLMIGGGYLAITGQWSWDVAIASLPYALGPTAVLFGKHIDKIPWDKPKGVRTMPVLLGEKAARFAVIGMIALQFILVVALVIKGFFGWPMLITLFALPGFFKNILPLFAKDKPKERPADYPEDVWPLWFSSYAFLQNRTFGGLFLLGLLIQMILMMFDLPVGIF